MFSDLLIEYNGMTAIVIVNREQYLNAINTHTIIQIGEVLAKLKSESSVRGVIITGAGKKAFVAGADIKEFMNHTAEEAKELSILGHEVFDQIANYPKPIVAAINGFALGGGLELAMACHIRIASTNARLGLPEVSLGLIPGYGGTQRLPRLVGTGKALEMILTGEMISAEDALQWGLVNAVFSQDSLMLEAEKMLEKMYLNSKNAINNAIQSINAFVADPINNKNTEIELFGKSFDSDDFREGVDAFLNKRKPNF